MYGYTQSFILILTFYLNLNTLKITLCKTKHYYCCQEKKGTAKYLKQKLYCYKQFAFKKNSVGGVSMVCACIGGATCWLGNWQSTEVMLLAY